MRKNNFKEKLKSMSFSLKAIVLGVAVYSFWDAFNSSLKEAAFALWVLGWATFITNVSEVKPIPVRIEKVKMLAVVFLIASFALAYYDYQGLALTSIVLAALFFFDSKKYGHAIVVPVLIWMLAVTNCEQIHLFLSYPMRVMGSIAAANTLSLFGISATASGTMINIEGVEIAITTACSGIEQLEAMILLGWISVAYIHKRLLPRYIHFLTILPIILFCNILRLIITLAGAHKYGEIFLSDGVHTGLGFATVFLVMVIFLAFGELFKDSNPSEDSDKSAVEDTNP